MSINRTCSARPDAPSKRAFTLVELLVVIAIVGALLALLLPALGKAKEAATFTLCAARLKGVGAAMLTYTNDYKGYYPYRGLNDIPAPTSYRMEYIKMGSVDDRGLYKPYLPPPQMQCPFSQPKAYDIATTTAAEGYYSYILYAGLRLRFGDPKANFLRTVDEPVYPSPLAAPTTTRRIRTLAADLDEVFRAPYNAVYSRILSHNDAARSIPFYDYNNATYFFSFHFATTSVRGLIDRNQVKDDGSVTTCRNVTEVDPRYIEAWSPCRYWVGAPPSGQAGTTFILAEE